MCLEEQGGRVGALEGRAGALDRTVGELRQRVVEVERQQDTPEVRRGGSCEAVAGRRGVRCRGVVPGSTWLVVGCRADGGGMGQGRMLLSLCTVWYSKG